MKKIFKKNQIAITSLAILIAVAGYLNFTDQSKQKTSENNKRNSVETIDTMDISDGDMLSKEKGADVSEKDKDKITAESTESIGNAVLTQAQVEEYVAGAKMEREQTQSKAKESLNEIINNKSVTEDAKKEAIDQLTELTDLMEKESATEQLLASKGFENAVVSIGNDSVDVVLNYDELTEADRAQIEDIVTRKTGRSVSQIVISKMQMTES
ncbi:MAG: SpoIIIAH-like family protein [Eubacterium sp.]|nr:SpoIIIAH-like family protein [Eubacterium sp.]MDD7209456.1 SpoIIIAH-like family protein [Lachnospiraceae bacterium]MDY5497504.1 SpoIIIAH-like family protein [Anaerobutyricum sp.]